MVNSMENSISRNAFVLIGPDRTSE
jgi:hypothetical protein